MRVFIDTNVLISFLLSQRESGSIRTIFRAFLANRFTLLLPQWLIGGLMETVRTKPRLSKRISAEQLNQFGTLLTLLAEQIEEIEPPIPAVSRDPDDDYVLAYALIGAADYLVTGDKDLLVLSGQIPSLEILTPAQFANILERGR